MPSFKPQPAVAKSPMQLRNRRLPAKPVKAPGSTRTYTFARWPTNDLELYWWVAAVWGMRVPDTKVCPNHQTPFRAFADAFFARHPVSVWKASRGFGGKSVTLANLSLTEAVVLGAQVTILGGSGQQSIRVHEATVEAWSSPNAPKTMLTKEPTKLDTHFNNNAWIRSLMASQTSVRGPHPQRLRLDEIDEMDLEILEGAQGQPMRGTRGIQAFVETQTVMSSTHQYPNGTMTEILKRAADKGWPVYEWCYKETSNPIDGWLKPEEVHRKRMEINTRMWETEYDLQEPSFEGRAIDTQYVEWAFDGNLGLTSSDKWFLYDDDWSATHKRYVTGIDWAKEKDWTVVVTFDTSTEPWTCVAWQRFQRLPWPVMVNRAWNQYLRFPGALAHDATGIGNVVKDYFDSSKGVRDITLVGRLRQDIFTEYIAAIEGQHLIYPRIESAYAEHKYVTMEDLFTSKGHPPDSFVAGALAWTMRRTKTILVPVDTSLSRPASPWMGTMDFTV